MDWRSSKVKKGERMSCSTFAGRPRTLITGASVGIGRELARVFARNGFDLVLTARQQTQLEAVADECRGSGVQAYVIARDLADPQAPQQVYDQLQREGRSIDVLVNNAGFGTHGPFAQTDLDPDLKLLQVNVVALTALTKLFLRDMVRRGSGRILNVASTAAFQPGPLMATYYASKAYVLSFTQAIAAETVGQGITVTALCPGPVKTEFQKRAGIEGTRLFRGGAMDARTVALAGYYGLMRGRRIVIPGLPNRALAALVPFVPRRLVTWIAGKLNEVH